MYFPVSGVEVLPVWPVASAFVISFFCSMCGISGAFLLLPYQMSVLGYVQPGVSATNQIFNILACPAGVWRFYREGRLLVPLALFIAIGTLPGVFIGALLRVTIFANLQYFIFFVAALLIYLALRLGLQRSPRGKGQAGSCQNIRWSFKGLSFIFNEQNHIVRSWPIMALSLIVGLIGGVYGIGGGAIMSPLLVSFFGLPIYVIAGACLFATFLTSVAGVAFYVLLSHFWRLPWATPDLQLGLLLGLGGILGMYCGASLQKYAPPFLLRMALFAILLFMGISYFIKGLGF